MNILQEITKIANTLQVYADTVTETAPMPVAEKPPLKPYTPYKKAPNNFPYEDYSLKDASDLRKIKPTIDKIKNLTEQIEEANTKWTQMSVAVKNEIIRQQEEFGLKDKESEVQAAQEKAANIVQEEFDTVANALGDSKKLLLKMGETLYTVYETTTTKKVTDKDKLDVLMQAVTKLVSPELLATITSETEAALKQIEKADTVVNRQFVSWKAPTKNLQKMVKEELPKHVESAKKYAGILDTIKSWANSVVAWFKGVIDPVTNLQVTLESAEPAMDEVSAAVAAL